MWAQMMTTKFGTCTPKGYTVVDVGPTGDSLVGGRCDTLNQYHAYYRLNGAGAPLGHYGASYSFPIASSFEGYISKHNDLLLLYKGFAFTQNGDLTYYPNGGASVHWIRTEGSAPFSSPTIDALGNLFVVSFGSSPYMLGALSLPAGQSLVRRGLVGESFQPNFTGKIEADQTGGVYRYGALTAPLDLGCGPMVPGSPASQFLTRLNAAWGCVYSRVLPAPVTVIGDPDGSVVLLAQSSADLDLGCGALPASPSGSTFVTRLDGAGNCLSGAVLPLPSVKARLSPAGDLVFAAEVGPITVDLGGGPLAPIGVQDLLLGSLDPAGNLLFAKRFGAAGVTMSLPDAPVASASNDISILPSYVGSVDFGGGLLDHTSAIVVASFTSLGAHLWSRAIYATGQYSAKVDGCGSLIVASSDLSFDLGLGPIIVVPPGSPLPPDTAVARFAP